MAKPLLSFSFFKKKKEKNATLDLFPNSPALNAVNVITSKLLQIESNGDQWLKEQVLFYKKKNGCWVCGIYTAGQMWLRWPSDQPLVSPYSASCLSIKPVLKIKAITNCARDIVLMYQEILRTLMSREMKEFEHGTENGEG